jgi:hypothetical protein
MQISKQWNLKHQTWVGYAWGLVTVVSYSADTHIYIRHFIFVKNTYFNAMLLPASKLQS